MNKNIKYILIELLISILFFISFELYYSDLLFYSFIFISITFMFMLYLLSLFFYRKNKNLRIILKKYSDILVHIDDKYNLHNQSIVFVKKFSNLIVAHERLGEPILYFYKNDFVNFLVNDDNNVLIFKLAINDIN